MQIDELPAGEQTRHPDLEGKDCNPVIMIDNIRVVPIE